MQIPFLLHVTVHAQVSITARQAIARVKEGSSFTFIWDYQLGSIENLRNIVFGVWEKGYTSTYFMTVTRNKGAVQNPDLAKTHPDLIGRIHWAGDMSRYAAFTLSNIMLSDNKTYGCQLGIGGFGQTKDSKITLIVEVRVGSLLNCWENANDVIFRIANCNENCICQFRGRGVGMRLGGAGGRGGLRLFRPWYHLQMVLVMAKIHVRAALWTECRM